MRRISPERMIDPSTMASAWSSRAISGNDFLLSLYDITESEGDHVQSASKAAQLKLRLSLAVR